MLVIRDTRESGEMLEAALAAGRRRAGGDVLLGGVLPTPAAPLLIAATASTSAAVISASHNPYRDNGIKFFGADGFKLSDATEAAIEARLDAPAGAGAAPRGSAASATLHGTLEDYLRELHARFADARPDRRRRRAGLRQRRDLPRRARRSSAASARRSPSIADEPDGRNINDGCGSTHVERARRGGRDGRPRPRLRLRRRRRPRAGRRPRRARSSTATSSIALAALHLRAQDRLPGDGVAVTVMTNYGFHAAMREAGIEVATTHVGDRYVLEELRARGWALGGEQSGHIIDMGFVPSGDGIAQRAADARGARRRRPRRPRTRWASCRSGWSTSASPTATRAMAERRRWPRRRRARAPALEGRGRVLVRPSGTEQLVRVMVEAPTDDEADAVCERLVAIVEAPAATADRRA